MQTCFSTVKTETSISVWRARAKSLSAVHFSSLLGSLKRLWQFSKWSFSQMPACGLQHRYDVYVQFMQMSPFPPCGRVSMRCLLFLWYQAATQHISVCGFCAYRSTSLPSSFRTLKAEHFFPTLPNLWMCINLFVHCVTLPLHFFIAFIGARYKLLETWKWNNEMVFCLDSRDGIPVCE